MLFISKVHHPSAPFPFPAFCGLWTFWVCYYVSVYSEVHFFASFLPHAHVFSLFPFSSRLSLFRRPTIPGVQLYRADPAAGAGRVTQVFGPG